MGKNLLSQLEGMVSNEPLSAHTTFKIGGPAKFFYIAKTKNGLVSAVKAAESSGVEYLIIGGGSNMLVSDNGFDGLVIKARNEEFSDLGGGILYCGAGLSMGRLVGMVRQLGLGGLEFMAGIPGTVGGAARGNAGAFGKAFGDVVEEVEVYKSGKIKKYNKKKMEYTYRESVIKKAGGVILGVKIKLAKRDPREIQQEVIDIIKSRTAKLPLDKPSAGSFFKNIELEKYKIDIAKVIKGLDVTEEEFKQASKHKLPIGFVLEKLDLKGRSIGDAQVSEKHANFIINNGHAKAEDVLMLVSDLKMRVRNQLLIQLVEEVEYIGF